MDCKKRVFPSLPNSFSRFHVPLQQHFTFGIQSLLRYTIFYNSRRDFEAPFPSASTAAHNAVSPATPPTFSSRLRFSSATVSCFFLATAVFLM